MAQNDSPQDQYGQGYAGYKASKPKDDPYASHSQQQQQYQAPDSYQQAGYGQQQQQQFASYQPPLSATIEGTSADDPTSTGMSARLQAMLSYLLGWLLIAPLIAFVIERKNRFARFAAAQALLFSVAAWIVYYILHFLSGFLGAIPLIGLLLGPIFGFVSTILGILFLLVGIFLAIQAYRGKTVRLPFFSGYAESLVDRTTRRWSI